MEQEKRAAGRPHGTTERIESDALRRLRAAHGWTQMDLAIALGCALSTVTVAERKGVIPARGGLYAKVVALCEESGIKIP